MTIVCQQCGALGWEDRLIYCSRCSNAAQHQYCVDTIPEPDEEIEWSCEDCNCRSINQASEEISKSPKIHRDNVNLLPDSNAFSIRDEKQLFVNTRISVPSTVNMTNINYSTEVAYLSCGGRIRDTSGAGPSTRKIYGIADMVESEDEKGYYNMQAEDYDDSEYEPEYNSNGDQYRIAVPVEGWRDISGMDRTEDEWFREMREINNTAISVGNFFTSKEACRNTVERWHVQNRRQCRTYRSDSEQLIFLCANHRVFKDEPPFCQWSLRAKKVSRNNNASMWVIVKVSEEPHKCIGITDNVNRNLTASVIADFLFSYFRRDPDKSMKDVQDLVHSHFHETISKSKAWRAREEVLGRLRKVSCNSRSSRLAGGVKSNINSKASRA